MVVYNIFLFLSFTILFHFFVHGFRKLEFERLGFELYFLFCLYPPVSTLPRLEDLVPRAP